MRGEHTETVVTTGHFVFCLCQIRFCFHAVGPRIAHLLGGIPITDQKHAAAIIVGLHDLTGLFQLSIGIAERVHETVELSGFENNIVHSAHLFG